MLHTVSNLLFDLQIFSILLSFNLDATFFVTRVDFNRTYCHRRQQNNACTKQLQGQNSFLKDQNVGQEAINYNSVCHEANETRAVFLVSNSEHVDTDAVKKAS